MIHIRVLGERDFVSRRRGLCAGSLFVPPPPCVSDTWLWRESHWLSFTTWGLFIYCLDQKLILLKLFAKGAVFCNWSHIHRLKWSINSNGITLFPFVSARSALGGGSPGLCMPGLAHSPLHFFLVAPASYPAPTPHPMLFLISSSLKLEIPFIPPPVLVPPSLLVLSLTPSVPSLFTSASGWEWCTAFSGLCFCFLGPLPVGIQLVLVGLNQIVFKSGFRLLNLTTVAPTRQHHTFC